MKPHTTFVGTNGVVELHPPCAIGSNRSIVGLPAHAKNHDAIWFGHALQNGHVRIIFVCAHKWHHSLCHLLHCLMKLRLTGIAFNKPAHKCVERLLGGFVHAEIFLIIK